MRACRTTFSTFTRSSLRPLSHSQILPPRWSAPKPISVRISRYHQTPFLRSTAIPAQTPHIESQKEDQSQPESEPLTQAQRRAQEPAYELTFTCKPCSERSTHRVTKQAYHHGSVLISCPGCKNRHLIADHLNIFGDKSQTIEDIMREKGELFKTGHLSETGDMEFWDDGSTTERKKE